MANIYTLGQVIRFSATVKTAAGTLVDAADATVEIRLPDRSVTTAAPVHDDTGHYHCDFEPVAKGSHIIRFVTTNPDSAAEGMVFVRSIFS